MKSFIIWFMFSFLDSADSCPRGGFGGSQPQFGPKCMYRCHCIDDVQCDYITGNCTNGCAAGWMGPGCQYGDIAYNKQVKHLLYDRNFFIDGRNATDGLPTTCVGPTTWVEIDLDATYRISGLVMNSSDTMNLTGYEVRVGNYSSDPSSDIVHTCLKQNITHELVTSTDVVCKTEIVGRYLLIRTPDNATTMTLCDVRVYGGRSLAYRQNGSQNSTAYTDFGYAEASRALDGNNDTNFWSYSCTQTKDETSPWWRVNLAVVYNIARIVLYGRSDCCTERLSGFSVSFATNSSFNLVFKYPMKTPPLMTEVITLSENYAQHVEISLKDITKPLNLCEVFVFGDCQYNMCGWTCDIYCYCEGPIAKQNTIDAHCPSGCKTGWWGYSCNNTCDSNCKGKTCNQTDGYCLECSQGKWGHFCDKSCINCLHGTGCGASDGICSEGCLTGLFGVSCGEHCGQCAVDGSCNRYTGDCIYGCQPGWQERNCTIACSLGWYGINCSNICGHCANTTCDRINGTCPFGCSDGYNGTRCSESCPVGCYGKNCSNICGHCANTTCDHINGTCPFGCSEGYTGTRCYEPCPLGWYGINCSNICGHCANTTCDHIDGTCPFGCPEGFNGTRCNEPCPFGWYGINCSNRCSHCANETCDFINGTCSFGCSEGYHGRRCYERWYGTNCINICGHCANKTCDHINGTCRFGCSEGYNGTRCYERLQQAEKSTESSSTLQIGIPVGGTLGAVGLTIIILFAIIYWKRRKRAPETPEIDHTYQQIDTTRVQHETPSDYSKLEELGLSPVIPKEIAYENTHFVNNLIPKCELRDHYQHYMSLDDKTGELRLLSLFKSIPSPAPTKTEVTRTGGADDCIETLSTSYYFETKGKKEFAILSDIPTTSEAIWRLALEHRIHLIIIIGENCISLKPKVQVDIGLIQIECTDMTVERNLLLCNINVSECEKDTKMRNVQVILCAEDCSSCIPSNINETLAVLKKRSWLRQGIEAFNTLINCTPDASKGECFVASLLMTDFMEKSGYIDIIGIIEAMRKEKHDAINSLDKFKVCHDVIFKWIVDEENKRRM